MHNPLGHIETLNLFYFTALRCKRIFDKSGFAFAAFIKIGASPPQKCMQPEKRKDTCQQDDHEHFRHMQ